MNMHESTNIRLAMFSGVLLLFAVVGCDGGPKMGTVKGVLKYNGEPISKGSVQFYPVAAGSMAAGALASDGSFELSTKTPGDGAVVGDYVVVVTPPSDVNTLEKELKPGQPHLVKFEDIPVIFRERQTSPLKAVVELGDNSFEFDLAREATRL